MSSLSSARIVVVGAGVLGLATASVLARRGAQVQVIDPDLGASSASAAAAGMVAPAMEAALEDASGERAELYRSAAALWPGFAVDRQIPLLIEGCDWLGPVEPMRSRLAALGFQADVCPDGLHVPGEARVVAAAALASLREALGPGSLVAGHVDQITTGPTRASVMTADGRRFEGDAVVLAAGWSAASIRIDDELEPARHISPVKGQIIAMAGEGIGNVRRVLRGPGVYLLPGQGEVIVGATMEPGVDNLEVDPTTIEQLRSAAAALAPGLANAKVSRAWAGIRGATPDGLPMAGATGTPGVYAALAPRRNGWLLAPLIAEVVAEAIAGEDPRREAAAFRPDRFDPA